MWLTFKINKKFLFDITRFEEHYKENYKEISKCNIEIFAVNFQVCSQKIATSDNKMYYICG